MSEPMDELEAVERARSALQFAEKMDHSYVALNIETFRALLARATRSHD